MACLMERFVAEWKNASSSQIKANIEILAERYLLDKKQLAAFYRGIKS
jgi:hypothetical protein